jgi:hypothetical protein
MRGSGWIDTICLFFVVTGFNVLLTFFVVSAYLDQLCEHLFRRAASISTSSTGRSAARSPSPCCSWPSPA